MSMFDYKQIVMPEECKFKISPSSIAKFFEYPSVWCRENLYGEPSSFRGNDASTIGTVCHYVYDKFAKNETINKNEIDNEIDTYCMSNPQLNATFIKDTYKTVTTVVINGYINKTNPNLTVMTELPVYKEIKNGIFVGGTLDRLETDIVVDHKTVGKLPSSIPFAYKIQALAYAWALMIPIDRIRIVYGIKPTKTIGARCLPITESITIDDVILIHNTLELMADTIILAKEQPNLIPLLFKSMKLKELVTCQLKY